jgi:uncharacterized protein (UPF0335 family)
MTTTEIGIATESQGSTGEYLVADLRALLERVERSETRIARLGSQLEERVDGEAKSRLADAHLAILQAVSILEESRTKSDGA